MAGGFNRGGLEAVITHTALTGVLMASKYFDGMGPDGEEPLTEGEKIPLARKIYKDLEAIEREKGQDFFSDAWVGSSIRGEWEGLKLALMKMNWFIRVKNGKKAGELMRPMQIWAIIKKKAIRYAEKRSAKQ